MNGNQSPANDDGSDNAARHGGQGSPADHKGWYWHRYLPHFDQADVVQGITFRLADSLPSHVTDLMAEEWEAFSNREKRTRIEEYLNNGYGACHLKDERIGRLIEEALLHFDDQRYHLIAWVVMPNHVHVLVEQVRGYPLGDIVHSWKSYTAIEANKILGRKGQFWYPDYFDRFVRDQEHLTNVIEYIHNNPVKAGLVDRPEEWAFSSARWFYPSENPGQ